MQVHASCAARDGAGVLLLGPSGSGKSDLLLRLLDHGFELVADDRVDIQDGTACAPASLAGLIEVRGLGVLRLPHASSVKLRLAVELTSGERMPLAERRHGVPLVRIDPFAASAVSRVALALRCTLGEIATIAGPLQ